jgi:hypothetical protein
MARIAAIVGPKPGRRQYPPRPKTISAASTHIAQLQHPPIPPQDHTPQPLKLRPIERLLAHELLSVATGFIKHGPIARQLGDAQWRQTMLPRNHQVARPAQLKIESSRNQNLVGATRLAT